MDNDGKGWGRQQNRGRENSNTHGYLPGKMVTGGGRSRGMFSLPPAARNFADRQFAAVAVSWVWEIAPWLWAETKKDYGPTCPPESCGERARPKTPGICFIAPGCASMPIV